MVSYQLLCLTLALAFQGTWSRSWHWQKVYDDEVEQVAKVDLPQLSGPFIRLADPVFKREGEEFGHHLSQAKIDECVANTNSYRQKHAGTPDLQWDEGLAEDALKFAQHLMAETKKQGKLYMHHATLKGIGENLFWGIGGGLGCKDANKAWYSEIDAYDFTKGQAKAGPKHFHDIGHFSQLVWKGTTKFAVGVSIGNFGEYFDKYKMPQVFVVGRYSPAGNSMAKGAFKKNIGNKL